MTLNAASWSQPRLIYKLYPFQMPKYIIQAGDPEAIVNPALVGTPRTPTIVELIGWNAGKLRHVYIAQWFIRLSGNSIARIENGVVTTIACEHGPISAEDHGCRTGEHRIHQQLPFRSCRSSPLGKRGRTNGHDASTALLICETSAGVDNLRRVKDANRETTINAGERAALHPLHDS